MKIKIGFLLVLILPAYCSAQVKDSFANIPNRSIHIFSIDLGSKYIFTNQSTYPLYEVGFSILHNKDEFKTKFFSGIDNYLIVGFGEEYYRHTNIQ
jgi:hypothetical protein